MLLNVKARTNPIASCQHYLLQGLHIQEVEPCLSLLLYPISSLPRVYCAQVLEAPHGTQLGLRMLSEDELLQAQQAREFYSGRRSFQSPQSAGLASASGQRFGVPAGYRWANVHVWACDTSRLSQIPRCSYSMLRCDMLLKSRRADRLWWPLSERRLPNQDVAFTQAIPGLFHSHAPL